VRAKIARLAALVPFGRCSLELSHLCEIDVSAKTVERVAELVGSQIGLESAKVETYVLSGHAKEPDISPSRLYVTVDGAMASMEDGLHECKVGAAYEARADNKCEMVAHHIEHVGTFGNAEAIGEKLYALVFRRGVERCRDVVVLGDGGRWIWNQARDNFPKATQIQDFYHVAEHLSEVEKAWHGAKTPRAAKWLENHCRDFPEGRWETIMRSIRAWQPLETEDIKTKEDNLNYFKRN